MPRLRRSWLIALAGAAAVATGCARALPEPDVPRAEVSCMGNPRIVPVLASRIDDDPAVGALVREMRAEADAFVFLSGGASKMSSESERALLDLFGGLTMLAAEGLRLGVGDGGTQAGIMQAAGNARAKSKAPFPLLGVSPAREIPPGGTTPVDPNHSAIIAVDNPDWDGTNGYFGSETGAMYKVFARLAEGKPSVTVVANGGAITLAEVDENIRAARPMLLVSGSGRAADVLGSMLGGTAIADGGDQDLREKAEALNLRRRPDLLHRFDLARGPQEFARTLRSLLAPP
jgi:hypothetical protein